MEVGAQLVDVRSPQEYAAGALPGAVNVPLQDIQAGIQQLDNEKPVIVYCASGMRSQQAAQLLNAGRREKVIDLGSCQNLVNCR
jgi:rhodanese-related sulfurtransferase